MSAKEDWQDAIAQIAEGANPASSPDLPRLYRLACDEARHALRRFPEGVRVQVDDLVHDLLFEKLASILGATNPRAFFVTAVRNAAIDLQRRERRFVEDGERSMDREPARDRGAEEVVAARAEAARVLALLSPREREIFSAIAAGEDRDEVAVVLGTTRSNIDQLVSRARRRLAGGP